jgi:CheY-like chemotaxis protein
MKGSILLVEDDPQRAVWFTDALAPLGYDVRLATDAELALDQFRETVFDLVFCDHDLGYGMNGSQLLYRVFSMVGYKTPLRVWVHSENPVGALNIAAKVASMDLPCFVAPFGRCLRDKSRFLADVQDFLTKTHAASE